MSMRTLEELSYKAISRYWLDSVGTVGAHRESKIGCCICVFQRCLTNTDALSPEVRHVYGSTSRNRHRSTLLHQARETADEVRLQIFLGQHTFSEIPSTPLTRALLLFSLFLFY